MTVTNEQALDALLSRVATLEDAMKNLQVIVSGKGSKQQLRQAMTINSQEVTELQERVDALEAQVAIINGIE